MTKGRKQAAVWQGFAQGGLLALGTYFLGLLVLAFLVVKGLLPESGSFIGIAVWCVISALLGGLLTVWRTSIRGGGLLTGAIFAGVLAVTALCAFPISLTSMTAWTGFQPIPLLCAAGGAAVLCGLDLPAGRRLAVRLAGH